ncbi:MAG: hypothetical protein JJU41_00470 [Bacteroidetes bacterium]|nr:hypothetical protein [Bacteroidota bacterium]
MQQYIRSVTHSLLTRLTDQQLHYTPQELLDAGFPDFVVKRIELELQRNLAESVTLPDSDWADMQADPVQDAWDNFLEAIHAETRIPDSYLQSVVENAVEDILELLAEPERYVLDTLFRNEDEVSILELHARRPWIVLNGHLADAIIRYMQRRNMQGIKRLKAANIIRQIDQHLAAGYSPLKWAQALDVCYILMGPLVPSALISRYFADKGLADIANRIDNADEELSRSRLIEYLSMPDLNWDDEEPDTFSTGDKNTIKENPETTAAAYDQPNSESVETSIFDQHVEQVEPVSEEQKHSSAISDITHDEEAASVQSQENPTDNNSESEDELLPNDRRTGEDFFASLASEDDPQTDPVLKEDSVEDEYDNPFNLPLDDSASEQIDRENTESILNTYAQPEDEPSSQSDYKNPFDLPDDDDDIEDTSNDPLAAYAHQTEITDDDFPTGTADTSQDDASEETDPEEYNDSVPIWQRFLNADQSDDTVYEPEGDSVDHTGPGAPSSDFPVLTTEARVLVNRLDAHADIILDVLFKADTKHFYQTLNTIATHENWRQAGQYLTREVFIPLEIDMYSGEAVLFVDLLQQYFEEKNA